MLRQLLRLALSTGLVLAAGACATRAPVEPAAEPTAAAAATAEPAAAPPPETAGAEVIATDARAAHAPSAQAHEPWMVEGLEVMVDEETGQRYQIVEVPKIEGKYYRQGKFIVVQYGAHLEVVEEGPDWFRIKHPEPSFDPGPRTPVPPALEADEAVAAAPASVTHRVDRLRFESFDAGLPTSGQWREGFELADMNGDGHLDLVFGPARKQRPLQPHIYLGDGAGTWRRWAVSYPAENYDYGDVGVGDFDGDGRPDIVLGMHLRGMVAMVQGDAGFELADTGMQRLGPGVPGAFASKAVTVADWNGDGRDDVVAIGEGPSRARRGRDDDDRAPVDASRGLLVYLNQGDGSWKAFRPQEITSASADFGDDLVLVDVDGDGDDDAVTATARIGNRSVLHRKTGETTQAEPIEALREDALVDALATADLDGDGHADLVLGWRGRSVDGWRSGVDVLWGHGDGTFDAQPLWNELGRHGVASVAAGDLDGDGVLDVVAGAGDQRIVVLLGAGERRFVLEESPELPERRRGCSVSDLRLADLDGDGRDEIIASFAGESTGLPGISADLFQAGCAGEGSLRAWTPVPR